MSGMSRDESGAVTARWGDVRLAKPCACGSTEATFVYEYRHGIVWSDVWICKGCHEAVYEWTWDTTQVLCQKIKAEVEAEQQARNNLAAVQRDARPLPSAPGKAAPEASVPWDKPKKEKPPKKQMGLF